MLEIRIACASAFILLASACSVGNSQAGADSPRWLAGDHHVHSRYSVGYDRNTSPPSPIVGGDAIYPIPINAEMAHHFGLSWMVATDHGGPNHSKVNFEQSYPELQASRKAFPDLIQFYGMELNSPGADHSSLIMPQTSDEAIRLRKLESEFDRAEAWPIDPARNEPARMLDALREMETFASKPVIIANHPSRSATGKDKWGLDEPSELRDWNDAAPDIAVGMAGAPGHQAAKLSTHKPRRRGAYERSPTMGGFDQMTATLGGFWDSMLGEGRAWWITANSDSHRHYDEGGIDFWPGEYSKTWVFAKRTHASILEALRAGHIFVSTGDLIDRMDFVAATSGKQATIGETLVVRPGTVVHILLRVRDPAAQNAGGEDPVVTRIDLIRGDLTGVAIDRSSARNPTTRIEARYTAQDWQVDGDNLTVETSIEVDHSMYLRVRGTNTDQLEPEDDVPGENPWHDLWFYSNPIFVKVAQDS